MRSLFWSSWLVVALSLARATYVYSNELASRELIAGLPRQPSDVVVDTSTLALPAKRSYDTHHYYAVETRSDHQVDPRDVAELLGVEFVERVGELKDHWLVRSEKPLPQEGDVVARDVEGRPQARADVAFEEDTVVRRWTYLAHSRHLSDHGLSKRDHQLAHSIRAVERQVLRRRHKRNVIYSPWDTPHLYPQVRAPIPGPDPRPYPDPLPRPPPLADAKHILLAEKHKIHDPLFPEQWHLANDIKTGNDLNVSGVWEQGITGTGINVALIDDGLDLHSPDLKENFVSRATTRMSFV